MACVDRQRRVALAARRGLSRRERARHSQRACHRLARLAVVRRARRIGIYHPLASEIDPRPLRALLPRACFYFPRVIDTHLGFVAPAAHTRQPVRWRRSALGVAEPAGQACDLSVLDVLILPLAGFDARANRIGLGGGFYDRTLAAVRDHDYRRPACIGLAFEAQRLDEIVPRAWDVPLAAVATERRIHRPSYTATIAREQSGLATRGATS